MVKGTSAVNIFIGLAFIYVAWIIIRAFELKLLSSILGKFINVGVIAVMVVFQQEIRKFLLYIGSNEFIKSRNWKNLFSLNFSAKESEIAVLIHTMSKIIIGAGLMLTISRRNAAATRRNIIIETKAERRKSK